MPLNDPLYRVINVTRDSLVGSRIRGASSMWSRLVGLLGQETLGADDGLWLKPSSGVHTLGMRFPIDIVALDHGNRVLRTWSNVFPGTVAGIGWRTRSVLELPAKHLLLSTIERGDQLTMTRAES